MSPVIRGWRDKKLLQLTNETTWKGAQSFYQKISQCCYFSQFKIYCSQFGALKIESLIYLLNHFCLTLYNFTIISQICLFKYFLSIFFLSGKYERADWRVEMNFVRTITCHLFTIKAPKNNIKFHQCQISSM